MKPMGSAQAMSALPDTIPEKNQAVSTQPSTSRPDPVAVPRHLRAAVIPHQTVESEEPGLEPIVLRSAAPAATGLSPNPAVAEAAARPRSATRAMESQAVESEERPSGQFAVGAIRPVVPAARTFPPAIHVTIGRVEVRATPPPTGSRAKAALPPVMSLEEYLGRRAAGGQR